MWARLHPDRIEIIHAAVGIDTETIHHSKAIFEDWTAAELFEHLDIVPAAYADTAPSSGHVPDSETAELVDGPDGPQVAVRRTWLAPPPATAPRTSPVASPPEAAPSVPPALSIAQLIEQVKALQEDVARAKSAQEAAAAVSVPAVAPTTQTPTIIERREEIDPMKLRAMVLHMLEERSEAVGYQPGMAASLFPLLSQRASRSGVSLAQAAAAVIDELAAIKQ